MYTVRWVSRLVGLPESGIASVGVIRGHKSCVRNELDLHCGLLSSSVHPHSPPSPSRDTSLSCTLLHPPGSRVRGGAVQHPARPSQTSALDIGHRAAPRVSCIYIGAPAHGLPAHRTPQSASLVDCHPHPPCSPPSSSTTRPWTVAERTATRRARQTATRPCRWQTTSTNRTR